MKFDKIMGETIEGIVARKNSVLILRSRTPLDSIAHAKYGAQITKWGASVGVRATLVPTDFDVFAVDDETGATLLQDVVGDQVRRELAAAHMRISALEAAAAALRDDLDAAMNSYLAPADDALGLDDLNLRDMPPPEAPT